MPESRFPLSTQSRRQLETVIRLLTLWGLSHAQQAQVLGLTVRGLRRVLRGPPSPPLSWEQNDRLRLTADILAALLTLYSPDSVNGWFTRPNGRDPFHGQRPLTFVLEGGFPALLATHRLLSGDLSGQFSATPEARALARQLPQLPIELDE
ncbi:DUF2384 domain-containing protein [Deinococcus hohokamensis]|uniref:DUF2384 domain-containing protein n=1 Tax=Deinococcus hohokamensis TaxID=309883 RepID=A0ABV9I781_9DEIO